MMSIKPKVKARGQPSSRKNGGFTLLELIIALGVIAIVSGGLFLAFRQTERGALQNAALILQADIRYAQRHAVIEGRTVRILFQPIPNNYVVDRGQMNSRSVYFENGVRVTSSLEIHFLPRGTPGGGSTIQLRSQRGYQQNLTIVGSGGRVRINPIQTPMPRP